MISLPDFEAGLTRSVVNGSGFAAEASENDRWVAVPFRERPDDPYEFAHDFSFLDLISTKGSVTLADIGLETDQTYSASGGWGTWEKSDFMVDIKLVPWSTKAARFQ